MTSDAEICKLEGILRGLEQARRELPPLMSGEDKVVYRMDLIGIESLCQYLEGRLATCRRQPVARAPVPVGESGEDLPPYPRGYMF